MDRLIATGTVPLSGADTAPATGTPQYATDGVPGVTAPTQWPAYQYNAIQEELIAVIAAAGLTPNRAVLNQLLTAIQALTRIKASAPLNLYVSTSGSDSNPGTSGSPFATAQYAWKALSAYDLNGYQPTINMAPGNYTQSLTAFGQLVGQNGLPVIISGPSGVVWNSAGAGSNTCAASMGAILRVTGGMTLESSVSGGEGGNTLVAIDGGHLVVDDVVFGTAAAYHMITNFGGRIIIDGNYTITGSALAHISAGQNGCFVCDGSQSGDYVITLSGTPAFSGAFASSADGNVYILGTTYSGAATGVRYSATLNGVIDTNGGGAAFFPGGTAGSTGTGGQYV